LRLPNAEHAVIDPAKLQNYLLSKSHPVGRFKATFFARLGYSAENWAQLEADIRGQHLTRDATLSETTRYGRKYEIRARLRGPSGMTADLVSVWILPPGDDIPRFVTGYPGSRR
jgi:hypothetical protein